MGALFEGYDAARKKRDDLVAEGRRKEDLIDHELLALGSLMSEDAAFLKDNGVSFEIAHRTMRVTHKRSPVVTVHYGPDEREYVVTAMRDGSHSTLKAPAECAKAIGEMLFDILKAK
jgi:hypothetical protein